MADRSDIVRNDDVVAPRAAGRMGVSTAGPPARPGATRSSLRPIAALVTPVLWQLRAARRSGPGRSRWLLVLAALVVAAPLLTAVGLVVSQWPYGASWVVAADRFSPAEVELLGVLVTGGLLVSVLSAAVLSGPLGGTTTSPRIALALTATGASLLSVVPAAGGFYYGVPAQQLIDRTFVAAPAAVPSPLPMTDRTEPGASSAAGMPEVPGLLDAVAARFNVLLLGGDAGPDRSGLRTDSLNLVSIDASTGDTVIIGIPRNLMSAPMPPGPIRKQFPDGFDDLINAVYGWGQAHPEAVAASVGKTGDPGASLVAASVAEFTGLRVDGWVLVDMAGFVDVIDALGGVTLNVTKAVPSPGNIVDAKHETPEWFTVGIHELDGTDALAYSRSRDADSDYQRMARQRCVLANLAAQHGGPGLLRSWPSLASALSSTVRTNLTVSQLAGLLDRLRGGRAPSRSIGLVPPEVPEGNWDAAEVRQLVADAIVPPPTSSTVPIPTIIPEALPGDPSGPSDPLPLAPPEPGCVVLS
jgi:LCP family protein required for cell wall assembly